METDNITLGAAIAIVKYHLDDAPLDIKTAVTAIKEVANMETHNSIKKDDLIRALRWLFEHYDFEEAAHE